MEYKELMIGLAQLPNDIADAEMDTVTIKKSIRDAKAALEMRQTDLLSSRDAKGWGSNDSERKLNQARVLQSDPTIQKLTASIAADEYDLSVAEIELSRRKNTLYAFRSASELYAAHILSDRSVVANGKYIASASELGL